MFFSRQNMESEEDKRVVAITSADEADDDSEKVDPELLVKHPLENKWALWYFKNDRAKSWSDNLQHVATFQFVEDFWS